MSAEAHYKVCPECRVEYTRQASRCPDCDVDLVEQDALPDAEEPEDFPPASELECVRVAPLAWVRALSDGLGEGGVPHRIEQVSTEDAPEGQRPELFGDAQLFGRYARRGDLAPAQELDGSIAAQLLPGEAPPLAEGDDESCPACGAALPSHARECPECGLAFG